MGNTEHHPRQRGHRNSDASLLGLQVVDLKNASLLIKAGRLASAFGLYPLEYDDAENAFDRRPLGYTMNLPLRPDQASLHLYEIYWKSADAPLRFHCGGATGTLTACCPLSLRHSSH